MSLSRAHLSSGSADEWSDGDEVDEVGIWADAGVPPMLSLCEPPHDDSSDAQSEANEASDADSEQEADDGSEEEGEEEPVSGVQLLRNAISTGVEAVGLNTEELGEEAASGVRLLRQAVGLSAGQFDEADDGSEEEGEEPVSSVQLLRNAISTGAEAVGLSTEELGQEAASGVRFLRQAVGMNTEELGEDRVSDVQLLHKAIDRSSEDELRAEVQALRAELRASQERETELTAALAVQCEASQRESCGSSEASEPAALQQLAWAGPRLRYLYSSPVSIRRLNISDELAAIERSLAGVVQVDASVASADSFKRALNEQHSWLHISMHSMIYQGMASFVLEEPRRAVGKLFTEKELEELICSGGGAASSFVFLAACQSERLAHVLKAAGVRHVVCCRSQVGDSQAISFAQNLYHAMSQQRSLREAFDAAASIARAVGDSTSYILLSDGNLHLELRCIAPLRSPQLLTHFPFTSLYQSSQNAPKAGPRLRALPRVVEDFVGRESVIDEIVHHLHWRRIILLQCEEPHGRTATLQQVARYLAMPGRFGAERGCAFFPDVAFGGLLLVDDAEVLPDSDRHRIRQHLAASGAKVLAACRQPLRDPFGSGEKAVCVPLCPLQPLEAAELFLRRVHRPLFLADFLPPEALRAFKASDITRPVPREEAVQRLSGPVTVLAGNPGWVRRAADTVGPGTPALHGNLWGLATVTTKNLNNS